MVIGFYRYDCLLLSRSYFLSRKEINAWIIALIQKFHYKFHYKYQFYTSVYRLSLLLHVPLSPTSPLIVVATVVVVVVIVAVIVRHVPVKREQLRLRLKTAEIHQGINSVTLIEGKWFITKLTSEFSECQPEANYVPSEGPCSIYSAFRWRSKWLFIRREKLSTPGQSKYVQFIKVALRARHRLLITTPSTNFGVFCCCTAKRERRRYAAGYFYATTLH